MKLGGHWPQDRTCQMYMQYIIKWLFLLLSLPLPPPFPSLPLPLLPPSPIRILML